MLLGHSVAAADGIILTMDEAICDLLQRPKRELVGLSYAAVTHPDDLASNVARVDGLSATDGPVRVRKRYLRAEGSPVWTLVDISRFELGPDAGRLVGSIHLVDLDQNPPDPKALRRAAIRIDAMIERRRNELGDELFGDHAWIILLQIYLAEAEGRVVDAPAITEGARMSAALIKRWLRVFELERLIERPEWDACAIQLTARGLRKIEKLLAASVETLPV